MNVIKHRLAIILFTLAIAPLARAQQTVNNASLSGRVLDPSGAVVANAQVTATQTATSIAHTITTSKDGHFRFAYLSVGPYILRVEAPSFAPAIRPVTLTVGADFSVDVPLSLASAQTSIEVSDLPPLIELNRSEVAQTISDEEVQSLSLLGRNFLDLALLVPGVSPTNTASTQLFAETSAVPGQG
ncbi:MAG: carboxypeptidase-like regulatory domain-containing protein, partial [Edaphobacter sp.]